MCGSSMVFWGSSQGISRVYGKGVCVAFWMSVMVHSEPNIYITAASGMVMVAGGKEDDVLQVYAKLRERSRGKKIFSIFRDSVLEIWW